MNRRLSELLRLLLRYSFPSHAKPKVFLVALNGVPAMVKGRLVRSGPLWVAWSAASLAV